MYRGEDLDGLIERSLLRLVAMVHQMLDEPPSGDRARAPLPELRDGAGEVLLRVRQDEEARVSELLEDLGEDVHIGHLLRDLGARQRLRHHL